MGLFFVAFQKAGIYAYGTLLCAMIAFLIGLVAVIGTLAWGRSRAWCSVGAAGLLFAGLGLSLGGLGTWLTRCQVDEVLFSVVYLTSMEDLLVEGYREARDVSVVALGLLAVPLLLNLVGAGLAAARARTSSGARPALDIAAVVVAAGFALLGTVSSLVGLPSSDDAARSRAVDVMKTGLSSMLKRRDCDVCEYLEEALQWRGAEQLERDVPGAGERARMCVEEKLAVIQGGKNRFLPRCRPGELTPERMQQPEEPEAGPAVSADVGKEVSPEDDARERALREVESGFVDLLRGSVSDEGRKAELEKLLSSPLLIDEVQKKKVAELIAEEEAKEARPVGGADAVPTPGESDGADKGGAEKGNVRPGAAVVNGRIPPEVIQRIVQQNHGRFRVCYQEGLGRNPGLEGRVRVRFVIDPDGSVVNLENYGTDLPDPQVLICVLRVFERMTFPEPEGGIVTVTYPLMFSPGK